VQQLTVYANVVVLGVGLGPEFGDDLPVELDQSGRDHFLGFAAGGNNCGSNDLLETLGGHA